MHLVPGGADAEQRHGAAGGRRQDPQVDGAVLVAQARRAEASAVEDQVPGGLLARAT